MTKTNRPRWPDAATAGGCGSPVSRFDLIRRTGRCGRVGAGTLAVGRGDAEVVLCPLGRSGIRVAQRRDSAADGRERTAAGR